MISPSQSRSPLNHSSCSRGSPQLTTRPRDDKLHQDAESEAIEDSEGREGDDLTSDVLAGLRELQAILANADQGYHKKLYKILAYAYKDAETLNEDRSAWVRFCKEPFWIRCKKKPEES